FIARLSLKPPRHAPPAGKNSISRRGCPKPAALRRRACRSHRDALPIIAARGVLLHSALGPKLRLTTRGCGFEKCFENGFEAGCESVRVKFVFRRQAAILDALTGARGSGDAALARTSSPR